MKLWALFVISIGTCFILLYSTTNTKINLIMGITFVIIGLVMLRRSKK